MSGGAPDTIGSTVRSAPTPTRRRGASEPTGGRGCFSSRSELTSAACSGADIDLWGVGGGESLARFGAAFGESADGFALQGGESPAVQRRRLEELYLAHADCLSTLMEADGDGVRRHSRASPAGAANFTLLRYTCGLEANLPTSLPPFEL